MSINFIHADQYAKAIRIASKFTEKRTVRPTLIFVNHTKDGEIQATNSQKLIRIKDIHGFEENFLVHPTTLEFATGKYPDVNKTYEINKSDAIIELNKEQIDIWLQIHRSINQLVRQSYKTGYVTLHFNKNGVQLMVGRDNVIQIQLPYKNFKEHDGMSDLTKIHYDQELFRDCLEAHSVLGTNKLEIRFSGFLNPVVLKGDSIVKTLFSPMKVY